jgi:hypothetical protein
MADLAQPANVERLTRLVEVVCARTGWVCVGEYDECSPLPVSRSRARRRPPRGGAKPGVDRSIGASAGDRFGAGVVGRESGA